jgi:hypothetical protein
MKLTSKTAEIGDTEQRKREMHALGSFSNLEMQHNGREC